MQIILQSSYFMFALWEYSLKLGKMKHRRKNQNKADLKTAFSDQSFDSTLADCLRLMFEGPLCEFTMEFTRMLPIRHDAEECFNLCSWIQSEAAAS